jgi:hypothetical protein
MAAARPRGGIPARLARLRDRLGAAAAAAGRRALVAARGETAQRLGRLAALTMALAVLVVVLYDHGDVPSAAARGGSGQAGVAAGADGPPGGAGPEAAGGPSRAGPGREGPAGSGRAGPEGAGSAADPARPGAGRGDAATSGGSGDAASGGRGDAAAGGSAATGAAGERPPAKLKRPAKPAEVAAAWYAARHRLPRNRVRPLQQDRVSARQVRVLVLAEAANGRLRTALVRVRLGPGGWEVR